MLRSALLMTGSSVLLLAACSTTPQKPASPRVSTAENRVVMNAINADGTGTPVGTITLQDSAQGLVFTPDLKTDLAPGRHGFHVHQNGTCGPAEKDGKMEAGEAAGPHMAGFDIGHKGPRGNGHLGDLPVLVVAADGSATTPVAAPRLHLVEVHGRALMIHAGGDNYADSPEPNGGGGPRLICGVIP